MGRDGKKSNKKKKKSATANKNDISNNGAIDGQIGGGWLYVDPAKVRYQHCRIRPYFSGCGRSVQETLDDIRNGTLRAENLPPIQVIVSQEEEETCYFSLNNRRLWVLKECRKEGLLDHIKVRVRLPKSESERQRYCVKNCSLDAKFMKEKPPSSKEDHSKSDKCKSSISSDTTNKELNPDDIHTHEASNDPSTKGISSNKSITVADREIENHLSHKLQIHESQDSNSILTSGSNHEDNKVNRTKENGYTNSFGGLEYDSDTTNES